MWNQNSENRKKDNDSKFNKNCFNYGASQINNFQGQQKFDDYYPSQENHRFMRGGQFARGGRGSRGGRGGRSGYVY